MSQNTREGVRRSRLSARAAEGGGSVAVRVNGSAGASRAMGEVVAHWWPGGL